MRLILCPCVRAAPMSVRRSFFPVSQVPYDDLRYLFGEIMYGGHITDDWDRRLCRTYLEEFIRPEMLEGELCLAPGFPLPGNLDYAGYHQVRLCSYGTWAFLQSCSAGPGCTHRAREEWTESSQS